jgi:zinc protease
VTPDFNSPWTGRKRMRYVVLLCAVVIIAGQASALDVEHKILDNGLEVFVAENHNAPVFTMRVYVHAGSIHEDEYLGYGISHYCEHLVSGGTTHKRTEAETQRILRAIGGAGNAYTTSDHTCYYIATSVEYADSVIDLLPDWVLNCSMDEHEVEREHGVIQREIAMGRDEPGRVIGKLYNGAMFVEHPEHYPTIGYLELFQELDRDDVVKYYERMYVPANMHVVAVGDFDADDMMARIETAFSRYPYEPPYSLVLPRDRKQLGMKYVEDEMDIDLTYMTMGWRTVTIDHDDVYPLHVLARILGGGRSSRLYRKVKEDLGLVHSIEAGSYNPQYDAPDFTIHVSCDYENTPAAQEAIRREIYALKEDLVSREEIKKAKTQIASEEAFGFQDIEGQASTIGIDVLRTNNPNYTEYYLERIDGVTREDIGRVVNKYFCDDAMTVAVLKPNGASLETAEDLAETEEAGPVERIVLDNGMTLLLKEDPNVPLVNFRAYFRGGSVLESPTSNGAFNIMARMFRRGTRTRSAEEISEEVDAMGGQLYSAAAEDYFTCDMNILSDRFDEGLELLADVIMNSQFDPAEFEKEREHVIAMIRQRNDDWQDDAETRLRRVLYQDHPYGLSPLGEITSVEDLSRDQIYDLYTAYCAPANMVLAVFGDVDRDYAEEAVASAFGRFDRRGESVPRVEEWSGLDQDIVRLETSERQQAVIFMGYPCMDLGSEDWYAMRVLDGVISGIGYPGGWLHETLRGQQLVYIVHAWNNAFKGKGYFAVMAATQPATADSALGIIYEKIDRIKNDLVSDEEMEMAKRACNIMEDLYYSQTTAAQAGLAAQYEIMDLGYDHRDQFKAKIEAVTKENIREVARKYLNRSATVLISPEGGDYETSMR